MTTTAWKMAVEGVNEKANGCKVSKFYMKWYNSNSNEK